MHRFSITSAHSPACNILLSTTCVCAFPWTCRWQGRGSGGIDYRRKVYTAAAAAKPLAAPNTNPSPGPGAGKSLEGTGVGARHALVPGNGGPNSSRVLCPVTGGARLVTHEAMASRRGAREGDFILICPIALEHLPVPSIRFPLKVLLR